MYLTLAEAIEKAKAIGWKVETQEVLSGVTGYQLKSPAGEYVQFGGTEEHVWQEAYQRGILTVADAE